MSQSEDNLRAALAKNTHHPCKAIQHPISRVAATSPNRPIPSPSLPSDSPKIRTSKGMTPEQIMTAISAIKK